MWKAARFWWACIRAAARGVSPFANDWQWAIGNPTVAAISPAIIAGLAAWLGSEYMTAEHPILAPLAIAFGAYIVTWVVIFLFRTLNAAPHLYYEQKHRADALAEQLAPRMQITFDSLSEGCIHLIPETENLSTGKRASIVRVLPICLTNAPIPNCQGFLNGVYWRASEKDHWQKTGLRDRLSLSWSTFGHGVLELRKGLLQYLDIGAIDEDGDVLLFVHSQQERGRQIFNKKGLYRLDVVVTAVGHQGAGISLQLEQTDKWDKPQIRLLTSNELEIA
jgi:hypothetical protein